MQDDPQIFSIPLLSFSSSLEPWPWDVDYKRSKSIPVIQVRGEGITEGCYGVKIEDDGMAPVLQPGMVAVFSQDNNPDLALENIFSFGRKGELPLMRKVIKNENRPAGNAGINPGKGRVRKSFMTPTPLHIPESRISPIAESTHRMIYFKRLAEPEELTLLPAGNLLWMHPLVLILPRGNF